MLISSLHSLLTMDIQSKLNMLGNAPELLEELIGEIPREILKLRRIPNKWSIHEHACHLSVSQHLIIKRFETFKNTQNPVFEPYLPGTTVSDDDLIDMDLAICLADFRINRKRLIGLLKQFENEDWVNEARHAEYFRFNPLIFLRHIMMHDHLHMYRIEELWLTVDNFLKKA